MKQLNGHLETRLEEQERRLCMVTNELGKTWHVVGRLRRHHHQLHTHEKILKYELQQKRKLLNELKEELEYCREKWEQAREKNTQSEKDWKTLRAEFSSRKTNSGSPSFNNSGESGYSDERPSDESSESNDESEYVTEPLMRCKKKLKKSFETILDSSTDFNLAAEREDPVSDMLDVADLPLDTQESGENHEPGRSESFPLNEKVCEETEDEVGDITHDDSCSEETNIEDIFVSQSDATTDVSGLENKINTTEPIPTDEPNDEPSSEIPLINLAEISTNNDEKLKSQERNGTASLNRTQMTVEISKQINNTLDHHIIQPTTSNSVNDPEDRKPLTNVEISKDINCIQYLNENLTDNIKTDDKESLIDLTITEIETESNPIFKVSEMQHLDNLDIINTEQCDESTSIDSTDSVSVGELQGPNQMPDFKAILENVRKQNERLAKKDERLQNLENSCSEVVKTIASTLNTGDKMIEKLVTLHNEHKNLNNNDEATVDETKEDSSSSDKEDSLPSTSSEIDHEARFAARDLRLKRLEEQTKSLVNKVNRTTSKGVKIHYKLEELHNIYGSESSRAGTPSEDTEEKSNGNDSQEE